MTIQSDTTNSSDQTTETTDSVLVPPSPDTTSSTTEQQAKPTEDGSILDPKPGDKPAVEDTRTDEQKVADEAAATAKAELFGAPEGDYTVALPEGFTLDTDALAAISPVAKELGLSDAGLSKFATVYAETILPKLSEQFASSINAEVGQLRKDWATDARASVEGGKNAAGEDVQPDAAFAGNKLPVVQQIAAKALDRFGGEGFREFLAENGLGNHPKMVRFAYLAGSAISEDGEIVRGAGAPAAALTREDKYYGSKT
jgi:hypothetical protein